ncbi:MAG: peptidylprolyl isomerase [Hyphomicrobium sp.]|nr:MAG: peptidylprolyl isomerase [Hyphomicrobium sp.]
MARNVAPIQARSTPFRHRAACAMRCLLVLTLTVAPGALLAQDKPTVTAKATAAEGTADRPIQSIVALVNDEPITGYEIEQRVALSMLGAPDVQKRLQAKLKSPSMNEQFKNFAMKRLKANPPKTEAEQQARVRQLQGEFVASIKSQIEKEYVPTARKQALDEIIEERLKMQEAKKLSVVAADEEVDRIVAGMAERNKMTSQQFAEHISKMGANITVMRERIRASLSWTDVIRRKFGHQITVASRDVDRIVASAEGQDDVELRIHRVLLSVPTNQDQKRLAQRLSEAERLRVKFEGCKSMETMARGVPGARFDNLGDRRPSSLPEPTRSLLLNAHDDELLPATIGESGVELWAVCSRKVIKAADSKRETAENQLRQKEFEILSKKHLKDLRTDAHIEFR